MSYYRHSYTGAIERYWMLTNFLNFKRKTPSKIEEVLKRDEEIIYKLGNMRFPKNAIRIPSGNKWNFVQIYITNIRIILEWENETWDKNIKTEYGHGDWVGTPSIPVTINLEDIAEFKYSIITTKKSTKSLPDGLLKQPELLIEKRNGNSERFLIPKASPTLAKKLNDFLTEFKEKLISEAQNRESALDYDVAIQLWEKAGKTKEATKVRKIKAEQRKVDQTVVHGDYVDDRDTIIKDSVLSRTNVNSSGNDKFAKLEKLVEMKEKGFIDDAEFKQMKKEILGK